MKKLLSFLIVVVIVLAAMTFIRCDNDPVTPIVPPLTDLEQLQQTMKGYWDLQKITIQKVEIATYNGGCNPTYLSYFPVWAKPNMGDIDFEITSYQDVTKIDNCSGTFSALTFTLSIDNVAQIYTIEFSDGRKFQLIGGKEALIGPEVTLKLLTISGGATEALWFYKRIN
jgi:hypothetical protein